jgi:3-dehydroquinate dehydratase-1
VLKVRGAEFGGATPLICLPLVAADVAALQTQAAVAHALAPDLIEWRADYYDDVSDAAMRDGARVLRDIVGAVPVIYTLRIGDEGGAKPIPQPLRRTIIESVLQSGLVDIVDIELRNGPEFIGQVSAAAEDAGVRVILSYHDFQATPDVNVLLATIGEMVRQEADIAKIACMPRVPEDLLRLLEATLSARRMFPSLPMCTLSMGGLGVATRAAGCLFGSDMTFAVGQAASAPGQIPVAELRTMIAGVLRGA